MSFKFYDIDRSRQKIVNESDVKLEIKNEISDKKKKQKKQKLREILAHSINNV